MSLTSQEIMNARSELNLMAQNAGVANHLCEGLVRYVIDGIRPGMFLESVLKNDLVTAVGNGRPDVVANLKHIVTFLYSEAPANCFGDKDIVEAWIAQRGLRNEQ